MGLGLGAGSKCCPFKCGCMRSTWPPSLYLSDPLGSITLARTSDAVFNANRVAYKFYGTRSATAYEYCWSPSPGTFDVPFYYTLSCLEPDQVILDVYAFRCMPVDDGGHHPFGFGYSVDPFGASPCINLDVPACFGATPPLVQEPGALVANRTQYQHYSYGTCLTVTEDVASFALRDSRYGCYHSVAFPADPNAVGTDVSTTSVVGAIGGLQNFVEGIVLSSPARCSSVVSFSFPMTVPGNFTSATVTLTS